MLYHRCKRVLWLLIAIAVFVALPNPAYSECLVNSVYCSESGRFDSAEPRFYVGCPGFNNLPTGYDIPQGTLQADFWTTSTGSASASFQDEFRLEGMTPGTSSRLRARLVVDFRWCKGLTTATLRTADRDTFVHRGGECGSDGAVLELEFNVRAGEPFRVGADVYTDGYENGWSTAQGRLTFADVPPGTRITSCNGYVQDSPVPVKGASWGSIKATYK